VLLMEIFLGSHLRRAARTAHTRLGARNLFLRTESEASSIRRSAPNWVFCFAARIPEGDLLVGLFPKEKLLKHSTRNIIQVWTHFICSIMYKATDGSAGVSEEICF